MAYYRRTNYYSENKGPLPEGFNTDAKLKDFYLELNQILDARDMKPLPDDVRVYWSNRMGRAHGVAYAKNIPAESSEGVGYRKMTGDRIALNIKRFRGASGTQVRATLIHEAAHIWTMTNCGRCDHSAAWKHVAQILGDTGERYAGCSDEAEQSAFDTRDSIPTQIEELTKRQVHSLRCSLKQIDRRYGCGFNFESFKKYVKPRFPQFTSEAMDNAANVLFA